MLSTKTVHSISKRRSILVTGCLGVVGKSLVRLLVESGWEVSGVDLPDLPDKRFPDGARYCSINLADSEKLQNLLGQHEGIVHLAGISRVGQALSDPLRAIEENILATAQVLDAVRKASVRPWVLIASTSEVKVTPGGAYKLTNMFGLTKSVSEMLGHQYASDHEMVVGATRLSGIYGSPEDHADQVPLIFVKRALDGLALKAVRNSRLMDYVHIDDVCAQLVQVMCVLAERPPASFTVFKVKSGRQIRLEPLARLVRRLVGSAVPLEEMESRKTREIPAVDWQLPPVEISLEQGLKSLIETMRGPHNN